jgi:anaerobic selenocysteine-containing dehydrogenase
VAEICWVPAGQLEAAARLLWESRPVASFAWSGVEQHTNVTQFARALALLYSLTGSLETEGGNVVFPVIPQGSVDGREFVTPEQAATNLGIRDRPLGPGRMHFVTTNELYRGIQAHEPHAVHGLAGFGANLLLAHSESARGRDALAALDFYVHTDLFMTPTAEMADIVLPVATPFERESLEIGFASSAEGSRLVQLRPAVIPPLGESRSDTDIVFDLACRLGLGAQFWDGDVDAAYRHQLEPTGIALETLRANPAGERLPLPMAYRQYAESGADGNPRGFMTLSGKVELYSETFLAHGYSPLPHYEEPLISPVSRPDLAARFPLILTTTKSAAFCESQHRGIPSLRRRARDPEIELHPEAAAARGIAEGDWVTIETPEGSVRTRATLNETLEPRVVCGQHGWWQACPQVDAPGYDPFSSSGANLNLIIGNSAVDPVSGSVPHRSYLCEVRPAPSA